MTLPYFPTSAASVLLACIATLAQAQTTGPASPSPAHERLTFFEGDWTVAGMPDFRETCAWLPEGRRHMVCRARSMSATGPREGWSIFSYNAGDSAYTYHGFRAGGSVIVYQGHEDAGVWRYIGEHGSGTAHTRTRITITPQPDRGFVFVQETSIANGPWKASEEVRYVRAGR